MRKGFGYLGIALLPLCCLGIPLLVAAGVGAAALAWIGGATVGGIALVLAAPAVFFRARRMRQQLPVGQAAHNHTEEVRMSHDCCTPAGAPAETGAARAALGKPRVEVLSFDDCPNHEGAVALVERMADELALQPEIRLVNVPDAEAARRLRFLGSPTVRVGGRDVEPGADERTDFVLSCRLFRTEHGFAGQPDEAWVRAALLREARATAGATS